MSKKEKIFVIILCIVFAGCIQRQVLAENENQRILFSGLKLWENNCSRCHNSPNPVSFSDAEWDVIGAHMRVRAYLTEKETNEIILFLKSIN